MKPKKPKGPMRSMSHKRAPPLEETHGTQKTQRTHAIPGTQEIQETQHYIPTNNLLFRPTVHCYIYRGAFLYLAYQTLDC